MAILTIRLFVLTVFQHDKWSEQAANLSTKTITTSAPRGNIYDRNGKVLATNEQVFNVRMYSSDMDNAELNDVAYKLIKLLKKNNDGYEDTFPIKYKDGEYYFTYDREIEKWLKSKHMPLDYTAEQAFNSLRSSMGISKSLSVYDAQAEMQNTYGTYPPISVGAVLKYTYENERINFLKAYGFEEDMTAEEAFRELSKKFEIEEGTSIKKARKIMVVRNALHDLGYTKYLPATISSDVSEETIIEIEENPEKYKNVEIASEYVRSYPKKAFASHVIGYVGKISDADKEEYVKEKGYGANDLIGQDGVEARYEEYLKGEDGARTIKVDALGNQVDELSVEDPVAGNNVYLTIDSSVQKSCEKNLENVIKAVNGTGSFKSKYGKSPMEACGKCKSGAAVVLDVKTGEVLGMANYPDFDPNLFATGISDEDWNSLQSENIRDPLSAQPLYNIATRSAVQPGSTFKPVTATAAMANGLDPNRQLKDGGRVKVGEQPYDCLIYTQTHTTHGFVNMAKAIGVSCNYYFYDIGQGRDYYTGASLGYKCGVDEILKYAKKYGLGEKTGIELTETTTTAPSAESKMKSTQMALENVLWTRSELYFTKDARSSEKKLGAYIDEIGSWTEENPSYEEVIDRLKDCGIKESRIGQVADLCKFSYFDQAGWTEGDALNISIGQGENAYTPLQLANYAATIGNHGKKNKVSIIKGVEGQGEKEKSKAVDIGVSERSFDYILAGMRNVADMKGGSLYSVYHEFDIPVCCKTGTAERGGKVNTSSEVKYIKKHLSSWTSEFGWNDVQKEMNRIMKKYPNTYTSKDVAVRQAVYNLSNGRINGSIMDSYKGTYENFAWTIALAPQDDPEIAVCVLLVQGKASVNAGIISREIIGDYFQVGKKKKEKKKDQKKEYNEIDTDNELN